MQNIFGRRPAGGFTLIELMIVVAVIAILSAIAYPAYQDQVRKSRRGQVKADLVEYAQLAERFHTVNNTYVGFDLPFAQSPREQGATAHYALALSPDAAASTFTIEAEAQGNQVEDRCGDLSLNQAGVKTNSKGALADCW
ncbi:type IV pilin protein [Lysobacter sp. A421]